MKKIFLTLFLIFVTVSSTWVTVQAQIFGLDPVRTPNIDELMVDYAAFRSTQADRVRLEIYYQLFNAQLSFEKRGELYAAEYEITFSVVDDDNSEIDSFSRAKTVRVQTLDQTMSISDYRTNQVNFELGPGKYKTLITLKDKLNRKVITRDIKLKLSDYDRKSPVFSDVEFIQAVGKPSGDSSVFTKGNLTVVPSVTRRYLGQEDDSRLVFYYEVYPGSDSISQALVISLLRNKSRGKMIYRDSVTVFFENSKVKEVREISLTDLPPGDYDLEMELRGRRGKKLDSRRERFHVENTPKAVLKHDYETVLVQLSYIAREDEIDQMRSAKTLEERISAFQTFWKKRDPTPGSVENEYKIEFYRRVAYVNHQFTFLRRAGWRTDRGRIYVMYGEPDQIDDVPYSMDQKPYQEWHYYRDGHYRKFVFVDDNGDGEYRLAYPYDGLYQRPDF